MVEGARMCRGKLFPVSQPVIMKSGWMILAKRKHAPTPSARDHSTSLSRFVFSIAAWVDVTSVAIAPLDSWEGVRIGLRVARTVMINLHVAAAGGIRGTDDRMYEQIRVWHAEMNTKHWSPLVRSTSVLNCDATTLHSATYCLHSHPGPANDEDVLPGH
ncbi:uncharacterized protein PHACADRAFT_259281 [Phanerochaete carnosa HHB-10118-sp]|uniref:Uncharacterized protein n=1 Tax=Phanerochaete carnosa (strain HHB-10118-sp) TaxID=650164 RepID=K5VNP9_PHACS|nr:uncharacterized protein PHACADRAFT_259281 [Phanerochaete carnosa HHB-10118-sp]EKM53108.1 hypothetical protein PHACADRAFT_259281 [Phanerochaete carnosa HHB-10118-sp]